MRNVDIVKSWSNNRGFTLLEIMFTLFILSAIVFLFPLFIELMRSQEQTNLLNSKEVEIFFMQLSKEIHSATCIQVHSNTLYITHKDGKTATYARYGTNVRRQVNGTGQERALQNIKTIAFKANESIVTVQIEGESGNKFERKLTLLGENQ